MRIGFRRYLGNQGSNLRLITSFQKPSTPKSSKFLSSLSSLSASTSQQSYDCQKTGFNKAPFFLSAGKKSLFAALLLPWILSQMTSAQAQEADTSTDSQKIEDGNLGIDLNKLMGLIHTGFQKSGSIDNNDMVLVLGNTGAGKTTLVSYLIGCEMQGKLINGVKCITAKSCPDGIVPPTIGHGVNSETLYAQVFKNTDKEDYYCDCPGFEDTRGIEERIASSISIQLVAKSAKRIKGIIVVIKYQEMVPQGPLKGEGFKKLAKTLDKLFKDFENPDVANSIIFVITDAPSHVIQDKKNLIETIKSIFDNTKSESEKIKLRLKTLMQSFREIPQADRDKATLLESRLRILDLLMKKSENIIVMDWFDQGIYSKRISNLINEKQISIPITSFNFQDRGEERVKFDRFIYANANSATSLIQEKMRLQNLIDIQETEIKQGENKIQFYHSQIDQLLKHHQITLPEKENQIQLLNKKIQENRIQIEIYRKDLLDLEKQTDSLQQELALLDTTNPLLYWEKGVHQPRPWWAILGWTLENFRYADVPFLKVEKTQQNGTFMNEHSDSNQGKYEVRYESKYWQDGLAKVSVYVENRNKPDHKQRIAIIHETLNRISTQISELQDRIQGLKNENDRYSQIQSSTDDQFINKQINSFRKEQQALRDNMTVILNQTSQRKQDLLKIDEEIAKRMSSFEMIEKISQIMGLDSSPLVINFLQLLKQMKNSFKRSQIMERNPLVTNPNSLFQERSTSEISQQALPAEQASPKKGF